MLIPTSAPTGRNGPSNGECGRPAGPRETCRPIRRLLTGNCGQHLLENQSPLPSGALAGAPKMVSQGTSRRLEQSCYYYPQKMSAPRRSQRGRARFFSSVPIHPPGAPPRPGDSSGQPHRLSPWCRPRPLTRPLPRPRKQRTKTPTQFSPPCVHVQRILAPTTSFFLGSRPLGLARRRQCAFPSSSSPPPPPRARRSTHSRPLRLLPLLRLSL